MSESTYIAISLILVVVFLAMNAFFVVAEFALVRVRKSQLELAAADGKSGAANALTIANNVNAYLSACQLGITLASLALGWLGEPAFSELIRPLFELFGAPEAVITICAVAIGYFIMTTLHVVVGELIPKSLAIFSTERYALATATPLMWFYRITYPIMWLFNTITNGVVRLLGHDPANEHEVYTGDEIKILVDESTESGLIAAEQNEFVDNVLDLGDKDAEAIMTPRTDVVFLDIDDSLEDNEAVIRQYSYSRYPVCRGNKDHIVGFVHIKDLYSLAPNTPMSEWKIREMPAVPETVSIARLIDTLQEGRTEICLVVDEHGGTAGIVTLSDVMEQIVGRIDDEYRHDCEDIMKLNDGTLVIDGGMSIDQLEDIICFEPPEADDVETLGGLIANMLDRIPEEGDKIVLEHETATESIVVPLTVQTMDRFRVDKVEAKIERTEKSSD
ncbi:hemolysin family protein [Adlercreutzia sp. ZJ304]|uniref:hemolysin family protein n=1 Tax=Adlercreutzia sp. ZJ304 TaxID=2709791 RepID=UPI001F14D014|nr:hemolysin family protein [Adlercreutzia sp. ZJ304]